MPIYPFVVLGVLFFGIMLIPPLVAAFVDMAREEKRQVEIRTSGGKCDG